LRHHINNIADASSLIRQISGNLFGIPYSGEIAALIFIHIFSKKVVLTVVQEHAAG
jgi:hypothetical protein